MRLLVTRPLPECDRTAKALRAKGHHVLVAPLLTIETVTDAYIPLSPWAGVLITSGNAVRALSQHPQKDKLLALPVFAVGAQTASAARAAGFANVTSADGDGGDLTHLVAQKLSGQRAALLYLAGNDRARDFTGDLRRIGLTVEVVVIYRAIEATQFPPEVHDALQQKQIDGVLHFSPRSAAIFFDCASAAGLVEQARGMTHYCLSSRVTELLAVADFRDLRVAPSPDEASLLKLVGP